MPADRAWLARVVGTLVERAPTLVEMARQAVFYLRAPLAYDREATAKFSAGACRITASGAGATAGVRETVNPVPGR